MTTSCSGQHCTRSDYCAKVVRWPLPGQQLDRLCADSRYPHFSHTSRGPILPELVTPRTRCCGLQDGNRRCERAHDCQRAVSWHEDASARFTLCDSTRQHYISVGHKAEPEKAAPSQQQELFA